MSPCIFFPCFCNVPKTVEEDISFGQGSFKRVPVLELPETESAPATLGLEQKHHGSRFMIVPVRSVLGQMPSYVQSTV